MVALRRLLEARAFDAAGGACALGIPKPSGAPAGGCAGAGTPIIVCLGPRGVPLTGGKLAGGRAAGARPVPSTMMSAPQRLHRIRTLRPLTLSSGTAYFAGQLPQETFMGVGAEALGDAHRGT